MVRQAHHDRKVIGKKKQEMIYFKKVREKFLNLKNQACALIFQAKDEKEAEELRISFLGKKGKINLLLKEIPLLSSEKRAEIGKLANEVKETIQETLAEKIRSFNKSKEKEEEWFDITSPGIKPPRGHLHLVTQAITEISQIFEKIGFRRAYYPEVDWDWYVFEGLNMPPNHPARDEWETFFLEALPHKKLGKMVLTPHTTNAQLREMEKGKLPIKVINIGKCYRRQYDVSHIPMFHQFDGFIVDKNISVIHLKGVLDYFVREFFGPERKARIRPFHFRFTEPSFEVDVSCGVCGGKGCKLCKSGWHELGGAGMIHPQVLINGGIDPQKYTGLAFGWGVERTYMMKAGLKIDDIRLLYTNSLRFLEQF